MAAGELEGWQRWSADQVREDLVAKAEGCSTALKARPWVAARCRKPCVSCVSSGSRRTRAERPTTRCGKSLTKPATRHTRWSKAWLDKIRAEAAEHKAQRLALIEEVKAWAQEQAASGDWKGIQPRAVPVR